MPFDFINSDHANTWAASKKHAALPQYRHAIRVIAVLITIVGDTLLIAAAALTAALIRFQNISDATTQDLVLIILPVFFLAAVALNCYRIDTLRRPFKSVGLALLALSIATGVAFTTAFALQVGAIYSRLETAYMLTAAAAYLTAGHLLYKIILDDLSRLIEPRVIIIGPDFAISDAIDSVARLIPRERPDPTDPVSFEQIYEQVRHVDRIILAFDDAVERTAWAQFIRFIGINAEIIEPNLKDIAVLGLNHWEGTPTLIVSRGALDFGERAYKRAFDLAISVPLLGLVGPWLVLLMLLIKFNSPGPAIFGQPRVGRNNRRYQCYKLRTMYADVADQNGKLSTGRDDNRITKIGKFLRRTSLDELPQLWNVIRGDMSLVGPRPHALGSTAEGELFWEVVPDYWTRHAIRPGMTGLAQVRGLRGATLTRSDIEKRVAADLEYINNWSIWLDLKILLQTVRVVYHQNAF